MWIIILYNPDLEKLQTRLNRSHGHRTGNDSLVRPQQSETDMRFGTWNVTSHYRSSSLTAGAMELAR
jgi:hypothetical protein